DAANHHPAQRPHLLTSGRCDARSRGPDRRPGIRWKRDRTPAPWPIGPDVLREMEPLLMATVTPVLPDIEYPESDGEPMGETPIHRRQMADVLDMLDDHYAGEPNVYISGNMMMYYVEGNPHKTVSPDVFVTLGIPKLPERRVYLTWAEGKGPDMVVEMHS